MKKDTEKKKRSGVLTKHQIQFAAVTAVALLSILGLSTAFILRVYFKTESACYSNLSVETENSISELESNLRSDRTMLRVIAGLIGNNDDIGSIEVSGYLSNYDINSLITQIGILLPDDRLMLSKGHPSSVSGTLSFEKEFLLGEHITEPQHSGTNSKTMVIRSYVPIWKDGTCIGLLFSAANPSNIAKAWLPSVYDKNGCCYVVNRKTGEVIINNSSDGITNISDIDFTQTDSASTKDGTVSNILSGKKGYSVFKSKASSEKMYMCYLPFSIEDWEMVVTVPESAVFSDVAPIRKGMFSLSIAIVIIILIYAIWLVHEIRRSAAETEKKANTDVLTGLQNRNRYESFLKKLDISKDKITCLYIDANGLHEINNNKGHFAGDQMLRFIADTLKVQFGGEHIYRIGGDEFVVFQYNKSEEELSRGLEGFNEALLRNNYHAAVGCCISNDGMSVNELIVSAEKDMYDSKQKYYNTIGKVMR